MRIIYFMNMRVTPLICWKCGTWFQPKSKRPQKFCCNACRQQNYLNSDLQLIDFKLTATTSDLKSQEEGNQIVTDVIRKYCDCPDEKCIECVFEKNNAVYCQLIYKYGRDIYNDSCEKWLKKTKNLRWFRGSFENLSIYSETWSASHECLHRLIPTTTPSPFIENHCIDLSTSPVRSLDAVKFLSDF